MDTRIISSYYSRIIMVVCVNIILAVSLNLVLGFTGQLTLGHAGFMSVGAYTAAILSMKLQTPFIVSLLLGAFMASIFAVIIGYPILRLKGDYLAICTLGFGQIIMVLIQNIEFVGGPRGLTGIPSKTNFIWVYFVMVLSILVIRNIIKSSQGRAIMSVREDEIAAEAMGINTTKYKLLSFVIAAFFAGLAGGLYAHYYSFIDPKSFDFLRSTEILTFVVFGGMGSISGSVVAAGALTFLPEILRNLSDVMKDYRIIIYSLLLIVMMIFRPQGLLGTKELPDIIKGLKKLSKKGGDKDVTAKS
jgi:branched-chain amino acid transport system permease protein